MKQTPLYHCHLSLGATMAPFAGWDMPILYGSANKEIDAVHTNAGAFDVSHMGVLRFTGKNSASFLQYVTANDINRIEPGKAQYSLLLNEAGGVVDDIILYRFGENDYKMVVNGACKDNDWKWLSDRLGGVEGAQMIDESDRTALIAIQGPKAVEIVAEIAQDGGLPELKRFCHKETEIAGVRATAARTGYTGEDGFELLCEWDRAEQVWNRFMNAGVQPCGLAARDVLRIEAAYPLYGHELSEDINALRCGVGWAIRQGKGDFIGRRAIKEESKDVQQKLRGLRVSGRGIPRENYHVYCADGTRTIGITTSGTFSPTLKAGIALARIDAASCAAGTEVLIDIRGRLTAASLVDPPFYRNGV
jgi:aminomethyltransferase